jgi:hypothetical protein
MAQYEKGILGKFSGTVGTVVGSSWKGIDYMRSKGGKRKSSPSSKQQAHQARFSLVSRFVNPLASLFNLTFRDYAVGITGVNYVFKQVMELVSGTYPALSIRYNEALIAKGSLTNADTPQAVSSAGSRISYSWNDNSGSGSAKGTDKVILVAYCDELEAAEFTIGPATRADRSSTLNVPRFAGKTVHTWISLVSADESEIATSFYTGALMVS